MEEPQGHQMRLEMNYPDGIEEWYCPTCGRRLLMQWKPEFKRVVIEPGEENVPHTGGRYGTPPDEPAVSSHELESAPEALSSEWEDWLHDVDFGALGGP